MTFGNDSVSGKIAEAVCCLVGGLVTGNAHGAHVGKHVGSLIGRFLP